MSTIVGLVAMDFCANFEGVPSHGQTGWNSFHRPPNHPPILNIMCHDDYAPLGAIVFSPWQAKVNANGLFLSGLLRAPPRELLL